MSKSELSYTKTSLLSNPPLRADGRNLTDYRPIKLSTGVYPQANGSARVECGGSEAVAGVMASITNVEDDVQNGNSKGAIVCNVSCTPSAYPTHSPAALDDMSEDFSSMLSDVYSHPSLLPSNLIVIPNKKAWTLHLDVLILSDGGNICDVLFVAALAAMRDCRIPLTRSIQYKAQASIGTQTGLQTRVNKAEAADFELSDTLDDGVALDNWHRFPVMITLNILQNIHFLDSAPLENTATPLKIMFAISFPNRAPNASEEPCSILQTRCAGHGFISSKELKGLIPAARQYAQDLITALDGQLMTDQSSSHLKR